MSDNISQIIFGDNTRGHVVIKVVHYFLHCIRAHFANLVRFINRFWQGNWLNSSGLNEISSR